MVFTPAGFSAFGNNEYESISVATYSCPWWSILSHFWHCSSVFRPC